MYLPFNNSSDELEKMIRKVTGRKKFKDRKPIFNIIDILNLLAFIAVPVVYNLNPDAIIDPFIAWLFVLTSFCFFQAVEGHTEGNKIQRIAFLVMGGAVLVPGLGLLILTLR